MRFRVKYRDIEIAGIHQLIHNSVDGSEELLQIVSRAGLLRDAVKRRAQSLDFLLFRNVTIDGIRGRVLTPCHQWRARYRNIHQASIFAASLRLQRDALAFFIAFRYPARFRLPFRRHDQRVQTLPEHLPVGITKHSPEGIIYALDVALAVHNA